MTRNRRQFAKLALGGGVLGLVVGAAAWAQDDRDGVFNVFISPAGKPFRAPPEAPYAVADWFREADRNGDGKIDHAEFLADAEAFFKVLDANGDGVLGAYEIALYEHRIAPEILGYQFKTGALTPPVGLFGGRLWKSQYGGMGGMGSSVPTTIDPQPSESDTPRIKHDLDESQQGASPFSLFEEPEPVTAADFNFNGKIKKANFLRLADMHFTRLDPEGEGYLTLAKLPKTEVQKKLERMRKKRR